MHLVVRVYAELVDLAGAAETEVPFGGPRSVKDVVESIGVPHGEVDLLLVDGEPVGFGHRLAGGERVAVYPPFRQPAVTPPRRLWPRPPEPRRFVLDVHLGTLARRLRLLGFDSWYRTDTADDELATVAVAQRRILLSRDRRLLMRSTIVHAYCPRSDDPDVQLEEVVERYGLASRQAPLTRCVRCNGPLLPVGEAEVREVLPPRTRGAFDTYARCVGCRQVYWPGAHTAAIERILARVRRTSDAGRGAEGTDPRTP